MSACTRGALALLVAAPALAQSWPTRAGQSGHLDVPDGEVLDLGGGALTAEWRYEYAESVRGAFGPTPIAALLGLGGAEFGLALREGGLPDDPRPSGPLLSMALKVGILRPTEKRPAIAIGGLLDRANRDPAGAFQISLSMGSGKQRYATFVGPAFDGNGDVSATTGLAAALRATPKTEGVVQGIYRDEGVLMGAAARWLALPGVSFGLGADIELPARSIRASLSVALFQSPPPRRKRKAAQPSTVPTAEPEEPTGPPKFQDERPRFRLRIRRSGENSRPQHPAPPPEPGLSGMRQHSRGSSLALFEAPRGQRGSDRSTEAEAMAGHASDHASRDDATWAPVLRVPGANRGGGAS